MSATSGRTPTHLGDAGYYKDFITAQGISDCFRDAQACATVLDQSLRGVLPFDTPMAAYQAARDEAVTGMYELTLEFASLSPPPPELAQLLGAMHGNQEAMDAFARVNAGVTRPADLVAPESAGRILAAAQARQAG